MGLTILETLSDGKAYTVETIPPVDAIRYLWAKDGEGETYWGSCYVTNKRGNKSTVYLHNAEREELLRTRRAVQELTGIDSPGWHYSQLARSVVSWLNMKRHNVLNGQDFLPAWHYQHCEPCSFDKGAVYDMAAAYWQVAAKAESPLLDIDMKREHIIWQRCSPGEEERWHRTKEALFDYKRLRLAIIGVCSTGWKTPGAMAAVRYFYRGELKVKQFPVGSLQPLALLTVRVAYELTQLQSRQARSFYSNADCCILEGSSTPEFWRQLGVLYRVKAAGKVDVCAIGAWACGDKETKPYAYSASHGLFSVHLAQDVANPVYWEQVYK